MTGVLAVLDLQLLHIQQILYKVEMHTLKRSIYAPKTSRRVVSSQSDACVQLEAAAEAASVAASLRSARGL